MSGFGIIPYGLGAYGDITPLSIVSAEAVTNRTVRVVLSSEPLHNSPAGLSDALNRATWHVQRVTTGLLSLTVLEVVQAGPPTTFDITVLEPWQSRESRHFVYRVSSTSLKTPGGMLITEPNSVDFDGMPADIEPDAPRGAIDLANDVGTHGTISGTIAYTPEGDYALDMGEDFARKMIDRRLNTPLGGFFHLPDYGLGRKPKSLIRSTDVVRMQADIERQLADEPDVEAVQAKVSVDAEHGLVQRSVRVRLRTGETFESQHPLQVGKVQF